MKIQPKYAGQSRRASMAEVCASTAVGYCSAVVAQIIIYPWFGIQVSNGENMQIAAIFTLISLVRGYVMRRVFNRLHARKRYYEVQIND